MENLKKYITPRKNVRLSERIDSIDLINLIQHFTLTGEKYIPKNNIVLMIELQNDGTGDYGWIKEYINIFKKIGYPNNKIYVVCIFEFKFNIDSSNPSQNAIQLEEYSNILTYLNKILVNELNEVSTDLSNKIDAIKNYLNNLQNDLIHAENNLSPHSTSLVIKKTNNILNNPINFNENYEMVIEKVKQLKTERSDLINPSVEDQCNNLKDSSNKLCVLSVKFIKELMDLFKNFVKFLELFKKESYVNDVNFIITDMIYTYDDSIIKTNSENKCLIFNNADFLNNSTFITFTSSTIPSTIRTKCNNVKLIEMQEGGMTLSESTGHSVISSGIGMNLFGLHKSFNEADLSDNNNTIIMLKEKITFAPEESRTFNTNTKYHYAYIGQLENKYNIQLLKFLFQQLILLKLIDDGNTHYLFAYQQILNQNSIKSQFNFIFGNNNIFMEIIKSFYSFFGITERSDNIKIEMMENNNYNIVDQTGNKTLKIRYYRRLNKNDFLSMIKYASSPVFSTGDLSTQEALLLNKYVIHDYIKNKQPFVKSFIGELNKYIKTKETNINLDSNIYKIFENIDDFSSNNGNFLKQTLPSQTMYKTFDEIITNDHIFVLKKQIQYYNNFKSEVIEEKYNFDINFAILLMLVDSVDAIKLPADVNGDMSIKQKLNNIYQETERERERRERRERERERREKKRNCLQDSCTVMGGGYYDKYIKYKTKYLKLKNNI
jgi:hypothetical protein